MKDRHASFQNRLRRSAPLLLWMGLIFYFSHQPKNSIPSYGSWDLLVKKGGHFAAYALLALLARWAGLRPWAALALAVVYAVGDEVHQLFIPGRNGQIADVLIDAAGAATALALLPWVRAQFPRLRRFLPPPVQSGQRDGSGERQSPSA